MAEDCTVVVDVGSSSVKAGFTGEDVPQAIFPAALQKYSRGVECIEAITSDNAGDVEGFDFGGATNTNPVNRGQVTDWDQMEKLWGRIMDAIGVSSPDNASIFLTESPRATLKERFKWAELLFDSDSVRAPSVCFGNTAPLSLFASGRTTGLVLECGAGLTSAVPVYEGLPLTHAGICMEYGGQDITVGLRKILSNKGITIDAVDSRQLKEKMAYVMTSSEAFTASSRSYKLNAASSSVSADQLTHFALPDGTDVAVDRKVFCECTEPLFRNDEDTNSYPNGIITQVTDSIKLCDDSVKKDLANNVIIAGGTSMLPGLGDRLSSELQSRFSNIGATGGGSSANIVGGGNRNSSQGSLGGGAGSHSLTARVIPTTTYREPGYTSQRKVAAWIGASIIGSIDTYKQLKITRQEWEESRESCIMTKCI